MTMKTDTMPPSELAELAVLDAFGLLEPPDQFRFEQAFLATTPDVQAEIRRIQADIATDEALLPMVDPPAELRARVLERIAAAMALSSINTLEPDQMAFQTPAPLARIGKGGILSSVWTWRMAALVLFGISLTLVVITMSNQQRFDRLVAELRQIQATDLVDSMLENEFDNCTELMGRPEAKQLYLASTTGRGLVRVSIDEQTGDMFLFAMDLAGLDGACTLEVTSADGTPLYETPFRTDRFFDGVSANIDPALLAGASFKLIDPDNRVLAIATFA